MAKQQVRSNEVSKIINSKLQDNIPRQQILDELAELYHGKNTIAVLIASAPTRERKEKYKSLNTILLALLVLTIVLKLVIGLSDRSLFMIPFALFVPAFSMWLAYEVSKYKGYIYTILGMLALVSILNAMATVTTITMLGIIDIGIALVISGLSFYVGKKMFPNINFLGPKKDANGAVILE